MSSPNPTDSEVIIRVSNLKKQFEVGFRRRRVQAVKGISFEVRKGRSFGFLGPNGSGKTTTIKMVTGLIFPSAGELSVLGGPPSVAAARQRFGFLPENPSFHDHLTGREVCNFAGQLKGLRGSAVAIETQRVLETVKLAYAADLQTRRYSKGMVQRLGIAQALVGDPELVILDEPTSGLDPTGRRDVKDLIQRLRAAGKTLFFSTHIIADVEEICDDVVVMMRGEVVRAGSVDQLMAGEAEEFEVVASGVPADFPGREAGRLVGGAIAFHRASHDEARELATALWQAGARVNSLQARRRNLETIFLEEVAKLPPHERLMGD